jgi:hypothetical protein
METRQKLEEEDGWDSEYLRLWREKEEREQWEENRWGQKEIDWDDCFTNSHHYA